jgi:hypothetical protein
VASGRTVCSADLGGGNAAGLVPPSCASRAWRFLPGEEFVTGDLRKSDKVGAGLPMVILFDDNVRVIEIDSESELRG